MRLLKLLLTLSALPAAADSVTLDSGRVVEGRLVEESGKGLRLETFAGPRTIPSARVAKHDRKGGAAFSRYETEARAGTEDPAAQRALLRTCLAARGFARAREHLARAKALAPGDPKAAEAERDLEKGEAAWRRTLPQPACVVLRVGTAHLLTEGERDGLVKEVRKANALLFRITLGGLRISELVLAEGSPKGHHLVYDKAFRGTPNGATDIPMGTKDWVAPLIVHEMSHALWRLPDDDNVASGGQQGVSKYPCIMAHQYDQGFGTCCRRLLCAVYRKERLADFFDRLEEECEGLPPDPKVTLKRP